MFILDHQSTTRLLWLLALACIPIYASGISQAQDTSSLPASSAQPSDTTATTSSASPFAGLQGGLTERSALIGDPWGLRSALNRYGITLALTETSEALGNTTGGINRGAIYEGLTNATLSIDTKPLLGIEGGTINITGYQIHGRGLSANNIGNLSTVSSIEADRSLRLFEAWYEQSFVGGKLTLRIGQQAVDQEFLISQYGSLFINSQFGWPTLAGVDLPSGANAFPLGTPGVRIKLQPTDRLTALVAVYNGDPAGKGIGDPQLRDAGGTRFDLDDGAFAIAELQISETVARQQGTVRLGGYYNSNNFPDQEQDAEGRSLASTLSSSNARSHHGDWALYGVVDQTVWSRQQGAQAVGVFGRVVGTPSDRNLVSLYAEGGINLKGLVPGRTNDTFGAGIGYTQISSRAHALDSDTARLSGSPYPVRTNETVVEITYQAQAFPWLILQPDFQYVIRPSGGVPDPNNPSQLIGDASIFGMRAVVSF